MRDELQAPEKTAPHDLFESRLEQEKLDAMKELAYGASHEINNPLANIAARAQTLLRDEKEPQRRQALVAIHKQALRAHEMISDLMLFARPPELIREKLDVEGLIVRVVAEISEACRLRDVRLITNLPEQPVALEADAEQLAVALGALCANSLEAIGVSGTITITLRREVPGECARSERDDSGQEQVVIEVLDDGPGISEQARRHLFDPFYSGREAGRGLGFGLSKCWRIITEHGGTVDVAQRLDETDSRGKTCFTISLPAKTAFPLPGGTPKA